MRTLDSIDRSTPWRRLRGDVALVRRILGMVIGYWAHGRRVRRRLARAEATGETYWLDGEGE